MNILFQSNYSVSGFVLPASVKKITFRLELTGTPDSTTDINLPASSLSMTLKSGSRSYVYGVLPDDSLIDQINLRPNGELVFYKTIHYTNGTQSSETEVFRANYDDMRYDLGPRSSSITVVGSKQFTNQTPSRRIPQFIASEIRNADGSMSFGVFGVTDFIPGDTADIDDTDYLIATVSHRYSPMIYEVTISE